MIDDKLTWKAHIEMTETKLSAACCVVTGIKPFGSRDTLKMTYFSYFHSIMNYGLIF
jgi:hypothetical protein